MKSICFSLLIVFFVGCGVNTDSSATLSMLVGPSADTNDTTDTNTSTTGDTGGTGDTGTVIGVDDSSVSGFSKTGAVEDPNACIINSTFQVMDDSSFDPSSAADYENGLELASQYAYTIDLEATKVALFYPTLKVLLLDQTIHIYEENYRLSFDKAWSSNNIANVYIRTPKDIYGVYSCYRYELDSLNNGSITKTKVYR